MLSHLTLNPSTSWVVADNTIHSSGSELTLEPRKKLKSNKSLRYSVTSVLVRSKLNKRCNPSVMKKQPAQLLLILDYIFDIIGLPTIKTFHFSSLSSCPSVTASDPNISSLIQLLSPPIHVSLDSSFLSSTTLVSVKEGVLLSCSLLHTCILGLRPLPQWPFQVFLRIIVSAQVLNPLPIEANYHFSPSTTSNPYWLCLGPPCLCVS